MSTAIYYFSGTGNSLYVAKRLNLSLEDSEIYPIVKYLNQEKIRIKENRLIIVFPIYALTVPIPVRIFIDKIHTQNIDYISVIATRLGLYFDDFSRIDKMLKHKNSRVNSQFLINMPSNDVRSKGFSSPTKDEYQELELKVDEKIDDILKFISKDKDYLEGDNNYLEALPYGDFRDKILMKLIPKMMTFSKIIGGVNYYQVTSKCNGCGICQRVCLSQKISMKKNHPEWNKKVLCYMCYACVNYCPSHAIEIESIPGVKSYSRVNCRYTNPRIEFLEIENEKRLKEM